MRTGRMLFPLLGLAALGACEKAADEGARTETERPGALATAPDPAAVRRAIDAGNAAMIDAFTKEDAAALGTVYETDGIVMAPNGPAWKGRTGIQEAATREFGEIDIKDMSLTTADVVVSGDIAVETGAYALTITPKGAKAMPDNGKYVVVWRRQADGSWKVYRDIWNSDKPAMP